MVSFGIGVWNLTTAVVQEATKHLVVAKQKSPPTPIEPLSPIVGTEDNCKIMGQHLHYINCNVLVKPL